jgi:ribosomal protein S18 acetylase RimI-like enzyme
MIHIRPFQYPQDYAQVIELWQNAGPGVHVSASDQPDELEKKLQRDPDLFLVACSGDRVIGTVMGGFDGRRGAVYHLAVAEDFRKSGVGTTLMDEVEKHLKAKGCIRYYLMVTKDNPGAQAFYEKRGCELMDLYVYAKNIS